MREIRVGRALRTSTPAYRYLNGGASEGFATVAASGSHVIGEADQFRIPHPELAGMHGAVASIFQEPRQLGKFEEWLDKTIAGSDRVIALGNDRIIAGNPVLVGMQSGEHRGERGTADGRRHIAASECETFTGQLIDLGGTGPRMPHERVIGPGVIVADDQHNIGSAYCINPMDCEQYKANDDGGKANTHLKQALICRNKNRLPRVYTGVAGHAPTPCPCAWDPARKNLEIEQ